MECIQLFYDFYLVTGSFFYLLWTPVHALHGLYDREIKEAPQYLEELFRLSKEDSPLGERWYKTYNG